MVAVMTKRLRKRLALAATLVVAAGVYFGFVFPTGEFMAERTQLQSAQGELQALERTNKQLQATVGRYESPTFLDKLAREEFGLIRPGEFSYQIMPGSSLYVPPSRKGSSPAPLPG